MKTMILQGIQALLILLFLAGSGLAMDPLRTPGDAKVDQAAAMLNDRGVQLYYVGRFEEALGSFILSAELDPTFAIVHFNCAVVLTTRGLKTDWEEAIRHLERSHRLDPAKRQIEEFLFELIQKAPRVT